jgi:hypothetical protein
VSSEVPPIIQPAYGGWLEEFVDSESPLYLRQEQLQRLAERHGITVNDIELRDYIAPPGD